MRWRMFLGAVVAALMGGLLLGVGASAAAPGAGLSLGPVVVPEGPLGVCLGERCETTPPVTSVTLVLSATAQPGTPAAPPTATAVPCPTGTGVAAQVVGTSAATVVSGTLTLDAAGGASAALPVRRTLAAGAQPLLITACTGG